MPQRKTKITPRLHGNSINDGRFDEKMEIINRLRKKLQKPPVTVIERQWTSGGQYGDNHKLVNTVDITEERN